MSAERSDLPAVVEHAAPVTASTLRSSLIVPAMVAEAGARASRRFLEFFAASIENDNTRLAYYRAVCSFFAWIEQIGIGELADIEPFHVAAYLKALRVSESGNCAIRERTAAKPTVKQHLAAIRMLFDWLVVGQVLAINPAHAVRGPKHVVKRGKTPVLSEEQARQLLASIKVVKKVTLPGGSEAEVPWLVGLRDRALISLMVYSFARISAVVAMEVEDYFSNGKRWWVRLHEKGGKRHEMPAHHKLEQFLDEYLDAAGIRKGGKTPLFRSAGGRTGSLTERPMHRIDAYEMIRQRTAEAGFKRRLGCHTCRATGITAYLLGGGSLENAQAMAAHESPSTTKLYDRTGDEITLDEVERIYRIKFNARTFVNRRHGATLSLHSPRNGRSPLGRVPSARLKQFGGNARPRVIRFGITANEFGWRHVREKARWLVLDGWFHCWLPIMTERRAMRRA
jgi:site-specific recombinase XerD